MKILKVIISIIIISFFLNFAWEFLQSPFYECFENTLESNYWHYIMAILWDCMYTVIIYSIISIINKNPIWIVNYWNRKNILMTVIVWLVVAVSIEYKWVYLLQKWNYSDIMPTILWIWIIPILQMMILPIISFGLIKKYFN